MFGWGWLVFLVCGVLATFGLPVLCVGLIVRLCEGSWGKRPGEMGSRGLLLVGVLLCLPLAVLFGLAAWQRLAGPRG